MIQLFPKNAPPFSGPGLLKYRLTSRIVCRITPILLMIGATMSAVDARGQVTWSGQVASIVYNHCTSCHRPGEIGPMPLTSYSEASAYASMIALTVQSRTMPPWQANPDYSHLLGERVLTTQEIQTITDWVQQGALRGDPTVEPPLPQFPTGSQLGQPDTVISMGQAYVHQGNNQDMYRVFVLPTNLGVSRKIKAIEFRPGNSRIVHHAILATDLTGQGRTRDLADPGYGYTQFFGFGFTPTEDNWFGWAPGAKAHLYPANIGKNLPTNADILVQMHYAPSSLTESDSSSINLFYDRDTVVTRLERILPISPQQLTNGPFIIPAGTVRTFRGRYQIPYDVSLMSVFPHSHLIGTSWKVYAVCPGNDTVPLIEIPQWDFNWQGFYHFPRLIRLPVGSWLYAEATYDNRASNPNNPNSPPATISWGEGTTDEMYLCYFGFVPYETGDELIAVGTGDEERVRRFSSRLFPPYPNPAKGSVHVEFQLTLGGNTAVHLLDATGRRVSTLKSGWFQPGLHKVELLLPELPVGIYLLELETGTGSNRAKLLVR